MDDNTYPNILSNDSDKNSAEFGLRIMKSAFDKWRNGIGGESSSQRKNRYDYNRAFASGTQPMEEYKDILDLDGDMSVINLSYDPLPIAIPFLSRLTDRYMQRIEKIQCNAVDPLSQTKREKAKADALFKLKEKQRIQALQAEAGVQLQEFTDDDPEDEKQLELEFGFKYKQREEVIMEQGVDLVFYDNDWTGVLKKRIFKDLLECGICQIKPYINANGRIKIRFTKPENIISSYTEWDDFRDAQIQGEVYDMTIADVRMKYPRKIGEVKLFELAQSQSGKSGNPAFGWSWDVNYNNAVARPYDSFRVTVVELDLKTLYNLKYESNVDRYGKEVLDRKRGIKTEGKNYIESDPYEVDYKGVWIVDTSYVLEWGLAKNMIKPEDNLQEVKLPWVTYMYNNEKMSNKPFIETMIPSIKKMQLIELQEQKIIANAAPDGFKVDISTMSDITLGDGMESLSPFDLYKIYKQTGVQYYKGIPDENSEGQMRQEPIQPMNVPFSGKLEQLMNKWNQEYDKLMRIVGSNNLDSGNITNQATGKQVLKEARQIGESSSNYIYSGYINVMERTARLVQLQLWDILVYGKKSGIAYYDGYRQALGQDRIEYIKIEGDDKFERTNFDVKIQAVIDDQEAQYLENNIQVCLANDTITLQDAIEVRLLAKTNIKYATYMLAFRDKKRRRDRMEEAAKNNEANTQAAVAAANAKTDGEMKLEDMKFNNSMALMKEETEAQKEREISKFASILKSNVASAILGKEGTTIADVPAFVFDGIQEISKSNKQIIMEELRDTQMEIDQQMQAQAQEEEAMMQQQMQQNPEMDAQNAMQQEPVLQ